MAFVVLLDANVLYPAPLRDLLVTLSTTGMYAAKWTDHIHDEWTRNLIAKRPELVVPVERTRQLMNEKVPDSLVTGYESIIDGLELPDPDDRHVLAAAIRCSAQIIVTFNLKDFPQEKLDQYGIEAMHPDEFIDYQFCLKPGLVIRAAKMQRSRLKNPEKSPQEFLDTLTSQGLVVTAQKLSEFEDLI